MNLNHSETLTFNYLSSKYSINVSLVSKSARSRVYKVRFLQMTYLLINEKSDWLMMADMQPCEKLRDKIIDSIKAWQTQLILKM